MATTAAIGSSTREKLERARTASAQLAQFSTEQKNALLLQMADAIESQEAKILAANNQDMSDQTCGRHARSPAAHAISRERNGKGRARCASLPIRLAKCLRSGHDRMA